MNKCILAIDPGGTTGMAIRMPDSTLKTFTCTSPEQVYDFIKQSSTMLTNIVIENFNAANIGKWGLHTVRIVGGVYALCCVYDIKHEIHMPQERYAFQKEAQRWLRAERAKNGTKFVIHEEDALAHLFRKEFDDAKKAEFEAKRNKQIVQDTTTSTI